MVTDDASFSWFCCCTALPNDVDASNAVVDGLAVASTSASIRLLTFILLVNSFELDLTGAAFAVSDGRSSS